MRSFVILALIGLAISSTIPPTLLSNKGNQNYFPSVVHYGKNKFAVVWQDSNSSIVVKDYPSDKIASYPVSSSYQFLEAIALQNGGFVAHTHNPDTTEVLAMIFSADLSYSCTATFSAQSYFTGGEYGSHMIPTSSGMLWVAGNMDVNVVAQYVYYDCSLGGVFTITPDPNIYIWGPNFPNGLQLSDGNVLVAWSGGMYAVVNSQGETVTAPQVLPDYNADFFNQEVVYLPNGQILMNAWMRAPTVEFYFMDSNLQVQSSYTQSYSAPVYDGEFEAGALLPFANGNFLMTFFTWTGDALYGDANITGIQGQIFDSTGPVTDIFTIVENVEINAYVDPNNFWNVAILEDNTFVVTWKQVDASTGDYLIYGLRMNSQGVAVEFNPAPLNRYTICDTKTLTCTNTSYRLVYVGAKDTGRVNIL